MVAAARGVGVGDGKARKRQPNARPATYRLALPVPRQAEPGECVRAGDGGMARLHVRHGLGGRLAVRTSLGRQAKSNLFFRKEDG
jgi:hypothetical protein